MIGKDLHETMGTNYYIMIK